VNVVALAVSLVVCVVGCAGPRHTWSRPYGAVGGHGLFVKNESIAGARFLGGAMVGRAYTTEGHARRLASGPYAGATIEMTIDGEVFRTAMTDGMTERTTATMGLGAELGFAIATYDPQHARIAPAAQLFVRATAFSGLREGVRFATGISAPALPRAAARLIAPIMDGASLDSNVALFVVWVLPVIAISNAELVVETPRDEPTRIGVATGVAF
jgi:hypothetical protein